MNPGVHGIPQRAAPCWVCVSNSADQTITASTPTTLSWNTVVSDVYGFQQLSNTQRLVVPPGCGGLYLLSCCVAWAPGANFRVVSVNVNGVVAGQSQIVTAGGGGGVYTVHTATDVRVLNDGDYVEAAVYHNSTGSIAVSRQSDYSPRLILTRLADMVIAP